jgi:L-lysine exporter family protein LysE/ArgO
MTPFVPLFLNGVGLGLGAAAPLGPVNVEIARRTLRFGRGAGFALGCGAVTVDVVYALVASVALLPVMRYPVLLKVLGVGGGLFLGWLGLLCLRSAARGHVDSPEAEGSDAVPAAAPGRRVGHYATGLLMTALNPMTLLFWFVGVPGTVAGLAGSSRGALPLVAAGVFAGAIGWVVFFTTLIGHLHRFGGQRWLRWIDLAGGVTLLAFAARSIWRITGSAL